MTTAQSPLSALQDQARQIAARLKAAERGEPIADDPGGKVAAARKRDSITFAVAMDDKILRIDVPWKTIRETSEPDLVAWIVAQMQEHGTVH